MSCFKIFLCLFCVYSDISFCWLGTHRYIAGGINAARFGISAAAGFSKDYCENTLDRQTLKAIIYEEANDLREGHPTYMIPFLRW